MSLESHGDPTPPTDAEMLNDGITRVPVDYFHVGEFRYTSLADAVAEARRRRAPRARIS